MSALVRPRPRAESWMKAGSSTRMARPRASFFVNRMSDVLPGVRKLFPSQGETPDSSDTRPVRESEQLDWGALARYARAKLAAVLGGQFDDPRFASLDS